MNRAVVASVVDTQKPEFRDLVFAFYVSTFRLEADRQLALQTIAAVMEYDPAALVRDYTIYGQSRGVQGEEYTMPSDAEGGHHTLPFPVTLSRSRTLEQMQASLGAGDNLLLEGDDAARILELCHVMAHASGKAVTEIFLSRGMHTSDIIGALRPHGSSVKWVDGPLTAALRRQDTIVLENIDAAGSELVEKLNMLLDHAGRLALPPEAEGESILKKEGECRIIAIKRTRRSRSQQTISRALRNRFFNLHVTVVEEAAEVSELTSLALALEFGEDSSAGRAQVVQKLSLFHNKADEAARAKRKSAVRSPNQFATVKKIC
jgi:MoxR-like ATPase